MAHPAPRLLAAALVSALVLAACTALLNFSPEGQPCAPGGSCLAGYTCVKGACQRSACGMCDAGTVCNESAKACVPSSCATHLCPAGLACAEDGGTVACLPATSSNALGYLCATDGDCAGGTPDAGRLCYRGQVAADARSGALRMGLCVEPCTPGTTCSGPEAQACETFTSPLDGGAVSLCLPRTYAQPCTDDSFCASGGLVCTVFDHPALGPATFCDAPLAGGAPEGAACALTSQQGASLCANGLCVPGSPAAGQAATCTTPCTDGTCPQGQRCTLAELDTSVPRHVPLCVTASTVCLDCSTNPAACGPDAPHCTTLGTKQHCLSACTTAPGKAPACPPGYSCSAASGGTARCVPASGTCP